MGWTRDRSDSSGSAATALGQDASADGLAVWERLHPGSYRRVSEDGEMAVGLPGVSEIRFVPRAFNSLLLRVADGTPAAAAGLSEGDVVIAVDGGGFTDRASIDARLEAMRRSSRCRLTLLRRGRQLDVEIDPSAVALDVEYRHR